MSDTKREERWIHFGRLGRPRGLGGWLWVRVFSPQTEALAKGREYRLRLPDKRELLARAEDVQWFDTRPAVRLAGHEGRDDAEALVGAEIDVRRSDLPPLGPGEYYFDDLVGLPVRDPAGEVLGRVLRVEGYPSVDVMVVGLAQGGEREVPIVEGVVTALDVAAGVVTIDPGALRDEDTGAG